MCKGKKCLAPTPCKNLIADHSDYIRLLRRLRSGEITDGLTQSAVLLCLLAEQEPSSIV